MKKSDLKKIQRVYQYSWTTERNGKTYKCGPYWRGLGYFHGIRYTIYIGKELPPELQKLLNNRVERTGAKRYTWPRKEK